MQAAFPKCGRSASFYIRPRYTSGSPAMLDLYECAMVAAQEEEACAQSMTGMYGDERKAFALKHGLSWIAYARWFAGKTAMRHDLITGETIFEPPKLTPDERRRARCLLIHEGAGDLSQKEVNELKGLRFRAMLHREEVL